MRPGARRAAALALGCVAGLAWMLTTGAPPPPTAEGAAPVVAAAPLPEPDREGAEAEPLTDALPAPVAESRHEHEEAPAADPTGDLAVYDAYPMSRVPHRVVRGWGLGPDSPSPGYVGAFVVVDPDLSDEALERLARDIRRYHDGAAAVSVRVVDLERAASYDRHVDGGALRERHLVARVQRNDPLELDEIALRGRLLDPGS